MFSQNVLNEMQAEYSLILDEIESLNHYLHSPHCSDTEKSLFTEMLGVANLQRKQISQIIDDYLQTYIGINEINNLLSA